MEWAHSPTLLQWVVQSWLKMLLWRRCLVVDREQRAAHRICQRRERRRIAWSEVGVGIGNRGVGGGCQGLWRCGVCARRDDEEARDREGKVLSAGWVQRGQSHFEHFQRIPIELEEQVESARIGKTLRKNSRTPVVLDCSKRVNWLLL